jgi:hypothetical protein
MTDTTERVSSAVSAGLSAPVMLVTVAIIRAS